MVGIGLDLGIMQLPVGVVWVQTQLRPTQLWLNIPQKLYYPLLVWAQFHDFSSLTVGPFIFQMYSPSVKVANLASAPKAFWHNLVPVRQLSIQSPLIGSVTPITPPVQPSQKDWSGLAQGVESDEVFCRNVVGQKEQQGRSSFMQFMMQVIGSFTVQGTSPWLGSQPLHDILPTQLFFYQGQTVAWNVSPFFTEMAYLQSEQYCWTHRVAASNRLSTRNFLAFAMAYLIIISKKQQRGITPFQHSCKAIYLNATLPKLALEEKRLKFKKYFYFIALFNQIKYWAHFSRFLYLTLLRSLQRLISSSISYQNKFISSFYSDLPKKGTSTFSLYTSSLPFYKFINF